MVPTWRPPTELAYTIWPGLSGVCTLSGLGVYSAYTSYIYKLQVNG